MIAEATLPESYAQYNIHQKYGDAYTAQDVEDFIDSSLQCARIYYPTVDHRSPNSIYRSVQRYLITHGIQDIDVTQRGDEVFLIRRPTFVQLKFENL